jgi:hypothetical protein
LKNNKVYLGITIAVIFLLKSSSSFSQKLMEDIDLQQIPQKKVRTFINQQISNNTHLFKDLQPTRKDSAVFTSFRTKQQTFLIKENLAKVWQAYSTVSPPKAWTGKHISFGVLISKNTDDILYVNNSFPAIDTGEVVFLNLRLLKGTYNLAVAFEITAIDDTRKLIEFSYIRGDKTQGIQTIQFVKTEEGYTRIIHSTVYKSDSNFRDRTLYPFFHKKVVREFHKNIKREILLANNNPGSIDLR